MNVHQFVLEYATERAGSIDVLADLPPDKEIGLGVVDPRTTEVETVDFVVNQVKSLLQYRRSDQIDLNPDCGFGTFADRPVNTTEIALQKLRIIHQAAKMLRKVYHSAAKPQPNPPLDFVVSLRRELRRTLSRTKRGLLKNLLKRDVFTK